jgi:transcriptional regulator with XRE-family HTH domain
MLIGERVRKPRKEKKLSQGDIEKRTGLVRSYISRVQHELGASGSSPLRKRSLVTIKPIRKLPARLLADVR